MLHTLYPALTAFIIRLAVFLAAVVVHLHGLRVIEMATAGNQRALSQVMSDQIPQVLWALGQIVFLPQLVNVVANIGAAGVTLTATEAVQVPVMSAIVMDVMGILTTFVLPLAITLCKLAIMIQGVYNIVASTTTNMFVQRQVWYGTVGWIMASWVICWTPLIVAGLLHLIILVLPFSGA
ncbi:MAG: hypothetical protein KGJ86_00880 [Chloroflexota bacterium]|nr:hypothetical protein [Chloroflexota bacterium]